MSRRPGRARAKAIGQFSVAAIDLAVWSDNHFSDADATTPITTNAAHDPAGGLAPGVRKQSSFVLWR